MLAANVLMEAEAQTDSTAVRKDSVTWNQSLDGVTVTAQRQLIKQDIDRIGYDVQADEDSRTENVLDMLRKVPMVTIDGNENILVKGNSDYKIYKNGHLDPSLSKNAKEILKAMPANSVKRIEVITDPGAREDAEGVNAILNIVMMDTYISCDTVGQNYCINRLRLQPHDEEVNGQRRLRRTHICGVGQHAESQPDEF